MGTYASVLSLLVFLGPPAGSPDLDPASSEATTVEGEASGQKPSAPAATDSTVASTEPDADSSTPAPQSDPTSGPPTQSPEGLAPAAEVVDVPDEPPPAAVQARDEETAPLPPREVELRQRPPEMTQHRRGLHLGLGVGVGSCAQPDCNVVPISGVGMVEVGYRGGLFAVLASISGGGGRGQAPNFTNDERLDGEQTLLFVGFGPRIYPVRKGPVDPYIGAAIGYSRVTSAASNNDVEGRAIFSRGGFQFTGGLEGFVTDGIKLGGQVAYTLPFAGEVCLESTSMQNECVSVSDAIDDPNRANERANRRFAPRPFTALLTVTFAWSRDR